MEEFLFAFLRASLLSFAFANVVVTLYRNRDRFSFALDTFRSINGKIFTEALFLIVIVGGLALALLNLHPLFRFGWTSLFMDRAGNILLMPFLTLSITDLTFFRATNIVAFFALLGLALPFFSLYEEKLFRQEITTYREAVIRGVVFGAVHLLIGIPLAAALAISVFGIYLGCEYRWAFEQYQKEQTGKEAHQSALFITTVKHTTYNAVLLSFVFLFAALHVAIIFWT